jgi:hypothetical protein
VYSPHALTIAYQEEVIKLNKSRIVRLLLWEETVNFKETNNGTKFSFVCSTTYVNTAFYTPSQASMTATTQSFCSQPWTFLFIAPQQFSQGRENTCVHCKM